MNIFLTLATDFLPHITYIGQNNQPEYWNRFKRLTNEYILYFITAGNMHLEENSVKYHLASGDALILEPGKEHSGYKDSACVYYYVHFTCSSHIASVSMSEAQQQLGELATRYFNESFLSEQLYNGTSLYIPKYMNLNSPAISYKICDLLDTAIEQNTAKRIYYKTTVSCSLMQIFTILSNTWVEQMSRPDELDLSPFIFQKTAELMLYLHSYYNTKITSQLLEEKMTVNFDYLNRSFKKRTGNTIFSYLNQIRLDAAKHLLTNSQMSMNEIAVCCGFTDVYYFSRQFKKMIGIPPSIYRKTSL